MSDVQRNNNESDEDRRARARLRGFAIHMICYFVSMVMIVPLNLFTEPENPWFVLPMVGWGSVLAIHAAYAMGLFSVFRKRD